MIQIAVYGRLGDDPKAISTRTGKPMSVGSLACDPGDDVDGPLWVGIVAFGRQAEALSKHHKGDLLSVSGRLQRHQWEQNGERREQLQAVADSIVSARTVRPGGRKKAPEPPTAFEDDPMPSFL